MSKRGEWFATAVLNPCNPGLALPSDGILVLEKDGTCMDIGCATEGVQLHFLCSCGMHYRLCTPHAIKTEKQLMCPFCSDDFSIRRAGLKPPSTFERAMHAQLSSAGLGPGLRPEYQPPGWKGRIDLFFYSLGVAIQVDGQHHFSASMHGVPANLVQKRDIKMCKWAWRTGHILLRAHYLDVESGTAASIAAALIAQVGAGLQGPCVILTAGYGLCFGLCPATLKRQQAWLRKLHASLPGAQWREDRAGCLMFTPTP